MVERRRHLEAMARLLDSKQSENNHIVVYLPDNHVVPN
jgi:hypothetical protein